MLSGIKRPKKSDGRGKVIPKLSKNQDLNMAIDNRWVLAAPLPNIVQNSIKLEKKGYEKVTRYTIVYLDNGHQKLSVLGSFMRKKTYYTLVSSNINLENSLTKTQPSSAPLTELEKVKYNQVEVVDYQDFQNHSDFPKEINNEKLTSEILLERIDSTSNSNDSKEISILNLTFDCDKKILHQMVMISGIDSAQLLPLNLSYYLI